MDAIDIDRMPAEQIVGTWFQVRGTGEYGGVTAEAVDVLQGYVILLVDGERVGFLPDEITIAA